MARDSFAYWEYETWPYHPFVIGWSKDRLGLPSAPLHYGLTWPVGIPTVFQITVTVPLRCNCLSLGLCKGVVKESTEWLAMVGCYTTHLQIACRVFPWGGYLRSLIKPRKCQLTIIETILFPEITKFSKTMEPKANFAHYITMVPLTDSMQSFSVRCISPYSLMKQRKCQITILNPVLLARNYDYSAKQWSTKPVLHTFKLTVIIFSLETNEGVIPKFKVIISLGICWWCFWLSVIADYHWWTVAGLFIYCSIISWISIKQWIL